MPPSPDLPPFGIRDLAGPGQSPGLIQITAGQYDATLKSQPDSSLTYLDDDDGDLITIGSSFELSQRLEEPVPQALRYSLISTVNPLDGNLVHVFDIKHSSGSLAAWREHEAYTSKKLKQPNAVDTSLPSINSEEGKENIYDVQAQKNHAIALKTSTKILGRNAALKYYDIDPDTTIARLYEIFALSGKVVRIRPYLNDQGQSQGSGFVLFSSESEANKALKELNGFSVGERSMKLCKLSSKKSIEDPSEEITPGNTSEVLADRIETLDESKSENTNPEPAPVTAEMIISGIEEHLGGLADVLQLAATTLRKAANKSRETDTSVVEDVLKGVKGILTEVGNFGSEVFKAFEAEASKNLEIPVPQESQSSLDTQSTISEPIEEISRQSAADDTFSYDSTKSGHTPIANDEQLHTEADNKNVPPPAAQQWKPSSPIPILENQFNQYATKSKTGSILDDETEDADFTARYPPLMSVRRAQTVSGTAQRVRYRPYKRRSVPSEIPGSPEWARPSVRFDNPDTTQAENGAQNVSDEKLDAAENFYRSLPGAWPEGKTEQSGPNLPTSSESSGAFFERMTGRSSHSPFPFSQGRGPRRYNTTASSNPASRLNKPFDPGFVYGSKGLHENGNRAKKEVSYDTNQQSFRPWSFSKLATNPSWRPPHLRQENVERFGFQNPTVQFSQTTDHIKPMSSGQPESSTHAGPRHFRSVPNFRPNLETEAPLPDFSFNNFPPLPPTPPFGNRPSAAQPVDKVDTCVEQLKTLGFGTNDRNMANRLHVYAVAADGDISQAVEMIEEDREAIRGLQI